VSEIAWLRHLAALLSADSMVLLLVAGVLAAAASSLWYLPRNKRLLLKLTARIPAGVLMCASLLTLLGFLFSEAMCGQYEFPLISSTDGKLFAQVNEVDCGAVDHFHSSVQLWRDRQDFFAHILGKRGHSMTVMTVSHDPRLINLLWKDDRTLLIRYPSDSHYPAEFRCLSQWESIQIECVGYAPDYSRPVGEMLPVHRGLW
jgi:hypothetical protein